MRMVILAGLLTIAACAENAPAESAAEPETSQASNEAGPLKTAVETIVREYSGDPSARVTIKKEDDTIVCGVAQIRGASKRFYVDLVDEEAIIEAGNEVIDMMIDTAC